MITVVWAVTRCSLADKACLQTHVVSYNTRRRHGTQYLFHMIDQNLSFLTETSQE